MGNKKPELILMCGISGSGKTTFAKDYASKHGFLYLCPDDFYGVFHGDDRIHTYQFEVWISLFQAIHVAEISGRNCIVDTNAPTVVDRVQFINWFPGFDHQVFCIITPPEVCLERNRKRRRVIPEDVMDRMIASFQMPFAEEDTRWKRIRYFRSNTTCQGFVEVNETYPRYLCT